jgi:hypothetical protein
MDIICWFNNYIAKLLRQVKRNKIHLRFHSWLSCSPRQNHDRRSKMPRQTPVS